MNKEEKVNILVAGTPGVGRNNLIYSVFKENFSEKGNTITKDIKEVSLEKSPIAFVNSDGIIQERFQDSKYELKNYIEKHEIHVAWVCISEGSGNIEIREKELIDVLLKNNIPVIVVITKMKNKIDSKLLKVIENYFPDINIVRVRERSINYVNETEKKPENLDELVDLTYQIINPSTRYAFIASQKVNSNLKKEISKEIIKDLMNESQQINENNKLIEKIIIYMIICISGICCKLESLENDLFKKILNNNQLNSFIEKRKVPDLIKILGDLYLEKVTSDIKIEEFINSINIKLENYEEKSVIINKSVDEEFNKFKERKVNILITGRSIK